MGGFATTSVIATAMAVMWILIAAALSIIAARRIRDASTVLSAARSLQNLLDLSPGRPLVVRRDGGIEADTRLLRELGIEKKPKSLSGLAGNDRLYGGDGNDELRGGFGDDLLVGGAGVDTASYRNASAGVSVRLDGLPVDTWQVGVDTLIQMENLIGSAYDDLLVGSGAANTINGRGGADDLRGLAGR